MAKDQTGARRERSTTPGPSARDRIMSATRDLLSQKRYSEVSVADILAASGAAKGSFYFYFASKEDLLEALVHEAVVGGLAAAETWTGGDSADPVEALRVGAAAGARLWRDQAPVLRAIVEARGTDADLDAAWRGQMQEFRDAALARLEGDDDAAAWLDGRDPVAVVTALTWLSERVYYLAATASAPFDDEQVVVDVLADLWGLALYGRRT